MHRQRVYFAKQQRASAVMRNTTQKHLLPTVPVESIMETACVAQCQPKDFCPEESEKTHNPSPDFSIQGEG